MVISAHNNSPWQIAFYRARLTLRMPGATFADLDCDTHYRNLFRESGMLLPGKDEIAHCSWTEQIDHFTLRQGQGFRPRGPDPRLANELAHIDWGSSARV